MARTKFNTIGIEYAGADLVDGGMLADTEGALGVSMQYSTDAVAALGADYVSLDNAGNAQGGTEVSVAVDYETEGAMLAGMLARRAFADGHQRGALRYVVEGAAVDAKAVFTPLESYESSMPYEFSVLENGVEVNGWTWNAQDGDTVQELLAALNDDSGEIWHYTRDIEATLEDGKVVLRRMGVHGAASNGYVIQPWAVTPFAETEETPISGGADSTEYAFTAGLEGFEATSTLAGRWRMVYRYSFVLGAAAGA